MFVNASLAKSNKSMSWSLSSLWWHVQNQINLRILDTWLVLMSVVKLGVETRDISPCPPQTPIEDKFILMHLRILCKWWVIAGYRPRRDVWHPKVIGTQYYYYHTIASQYFRLKVDFKPKIFYIRWNILLITTILINSIHIEWVPILHPLPFSLYLRHGFRSESEDVMANRVNAFYFNQNRLYVVYAWTACLGCALSCVSEGIYLSSGQLVYEDHWCSSYSFLHI